MTSQPSHEAVQPSNEQTASDIACASQSHLAGETAMQGGAPGTSPESSAVEVGPATAADSSRQVDSAGLPTGQEGKERSLFAEALERYSAGRRMTAPHQLATPPEAGPQPSRESLHLESGFYDQASELWDRIANKISDGSGLSSSSSLLSYVFSENAYQLITARADQVFAHDTLARLIERIRTWSQQTLGLSHVSTPALRIYASGCWRGVMRDDIAASWHYVFALTRNSGGRLGRLKIVTEATPDAVRSGLSAARIATTRLNFNEFLAHDVNMPYGVDVAKGAISPLQGTIFLEGYIW